MSDHNKSVVRRLLDELWNKGDLSLADQFFATTYTHHDASSPDFGKGPESERKRATLYRTAFPDLRMTIEDLFADGENVITRWSCHGTHKGDINDIAPTGKRIHITGVSITRFSHDKMVEGFVNWDALGLMRQLGVVPQLAAKAQAAVASAR
jgi:predicted ester cyclase